MTIRIGLSPHERIFEPLLPSSLGSALQFRLARLFCFPVALSGLLSALAVLTARNRFYDSDLWWHLKTGQLIWNNLASGRNIPSIDRFSFTAAGHPLVPHEWLAQLALFAAWRASGNTGLMLAFCTLTAAILVAGYALCALYAQNVRVAFLGALAIFVFATAGFSIRPQLFGYLLLILEMAILHLGRSRDRRWFFALPPLFTLWVNFHGSFFLGLIVAAISLLCSLCTFATGALLAKPLPTRDRRALGTALLLSAAATLLNPAGLRQSLYPLDTLLRQPINLASIDEWKPLALNTQRGLCLVALLAAIFLLALLRKATLHLDELILLALASWLAVSHQRLVFAFGILTAPILARMLAGLWGNHHPAPRILPNALLLTLAAITIAAAFPSPANLAAQVDKEAPGQALAYLRDHPLPGNLLNDYQFGGYLIWAAPDHPVFIDGRADLYEWAGILGQYTAWASLQSDPNTLLDRYRINLCLLSAHAPTVRVLRLLPAWKQTYADSHAVLFERVSPFS